MTWVVSGKLSQGWVDVLRFGARFSCESRSVLRAWRCGAKLWTGVAHDKKCFPKRKAPTASPPTALSRSLCVLTRAWHNNALTLPQTELLPSRSSSDSDKTYGLKCERPIVRRAAVGGSPRSGGGFAPCMLTRHPPPPGDTGGHVHFKTERVENRKSQNSYVSEGQICRQRLLARPRACRDRVGRRRADEDRKLGPRPLRLNSETL